MSKTALEIGLIVGGLALAVLAGPLGILAMQGNVAMFNAMVGIGLTTSLTGVGIALRPNIKPVGISNALSFNQGPTPRRVIYGQFQTAGVLTYVSFPPNQNQSLDSQYLQLVYTITGHEIESFDAVIVDGTVRNFGVDIVYDSGDGFWHVNPNSSGSFDDLYWQHMFFEFDCGKNNSAQPFPNLAGGDPTWTAACLQRRCAKVHVVLRYDAGYTSIFPSGRQPNIQFLVTGKKIIDTRVYTSWLPLNSYAPWTYIIDNNGYIWYVSAAGGSGSVRPPFESYVGGGTSLTDGTVTWYQVAWTITGVYNGNTAPPQMFNQRLVNDGWFPGVAWTVGYVMEAPTGYLQLCTAAGTGAAAHPNFATSLGTTTTDGGATWTCLGQSTHAINPSNSALVVNDYLQDGDYGLSAPASTIDTTSVSAAANVCEEQTLIIWNADNTVVYENLYSTNGMFDHSSVRGNVLTSLCGAMAGWVIPPGDMWHVFAGSFQTPTVALGDSDMRGPIKGDFRLSKRDLLNTVGAQFVPAFLPANPAAGLSLTQVPSTWTSMSAPEYQANGLAGKPNYLNSEDGGQILRIRLQLDFTTSLWTAQRLEKIAMMRSRFPQTLTLPCKLTALQLEAGDTFYYTHARWNILGQAFEATQASVAIEMSHSGSGQGADGPTLGVDIIARQTDPSIYEYTGPSSASDYGEYSPYGITGVMTGVE